MSVSLEEALARRSVVVCVGSGGVGKTTIAATLGMHAAAAGRRVMVCTIDPARRLAGALGLEAFGNAERRVDEARLREAGVHLRGQLFATMLDLKRSWDDFVARNVAPEQQEIIFANRFYQTLSSALAGSQEYIAMERLYELHARGDYDLVVLDTPPTAHALDFLEAPGRVLDFLENEAARTILAPLVGAGRFSLRLFQRGGGVVARALSRITGLETLEELGRFLVETEGFHGVFRERAARVRELLGSEQAAFVLVTSAAALTIEEAVHFHGRLVGERVPVTAIVANRVERDFLDDLPDPQPLAVGDALALAGVPDEGNPPLSARLCDTALALRRLARADARSLARLRAETEPTEVRVVPRIEADLHDLSGLRAVRDLLFPGHA